MHSQKRVFGSIVILCSLCVLFTGCGTICNVSLGRRICVYGGIQKDVECIKDGSRWLALSDILPIGGGMGGVICLFQWVGGVVDMPLSFVGDTLTIPYVLFRQQYRSAGERRMGIANRIHITHKATDGPYVEFTTVVRSPEHFSNQVLRSIVNVRGNVRGDSFVLPDGRIRLDMLAPLDASEYTSHIRYWCSGERAEKGVFPCIVLQKHDQDPREKFPNSFEGKWRIFGTHRLEPYNEYRPSDKMFRFQQKNDEYRPPDWRYWLTMEADETGLVGTMTSGQVRGTIRGQVQNDGTFKGTCQMVGESDAWEITLHLSPYRNIAEGFGILPVLAPHQTNYYSIRMLR